MCSSNYKESNGKYWIIIRLCASIGMPNIILSCYFVVFYIVYTRLIEYAKAQFRIVSIFNKRRVFFVFFVFSKNSVAGCCENIRFCTSILLLCDYSIHSKIGTYFIENSIRNIIEAIWRWLLNKGTNFEATDVWAIRFFFKDLVHFRDET